jgi:long-chain acyl-CoA synthetase
MNVDLPTLTLARLSRVLENHGPGDLSLSQYRVLGLLSSGHERAGDLAARLAVTKPTLTALVDGLVERG